jgi:hypothetical protein
MAQMADSLSTTPRFLAHDLVVGVLAGVGVGAFAGMWFSARVWQGGLTVLIGAILGAAVGYGLLRLSHRDGERLVNPTVVIAWVLGLLGWAMVIGVIMAIRNFN